MVRSSRVRQSYDLVAGRYAAEIADELAGKPLDRALLDAFANGAEGLVLDVGCGPGHVAGYLAARGCPVVGLDLSPAMCAVATAATSLPYAAADMTALPVRSSSVGGIVCFYAVIHLDEAGRAAAYRELARVLRPGGQALIAFHTSDADVATGGTMALTEWWGEDVELTFHYLDPADEVRALAGAGLDLVARLDRAPYPDVEHASQRSYLLVVRR